MTTEARLQISRALDTLEELLPGDNETEADKAYYQQLHDLSESDIGFLEEAAGALSQLVW